jgi:hypothetical protein
MDFDGDETNEHVPYVSEGLDVNNELLRDIIIDTMNDKTASKREKYGNILFAMILEELFLGEHDVNKDGQIEICI